MTPAERRACLGDEVIAQIRERVAAAPDAPPTALDALRPIFSRPARRVRRRPTAADAA